MVFFLWVAYFPQIMYCIVYLVLDLLHPIRLLWKSYLGLNIFFLAAGALKFLIRAGWGKLIKMLYIFRLTFLVKTDFSNSSQKMGKKASKSLLGKLY